jgi:hypothetical protein
MSTTAERKQQFFNKKFPDPKVASHNGKRADYHLLSLIIILSLDEKTRDDTFGDGCTINANAILQHEEYRNVIDSSRVLAAHVEALAPYVDAFRGVKMAWASLDEYNPEPCPTRAALAELARITQRLPDSGSTL